MMLTERLRDLHCHSCGGEDPNCDALVLSPRCHMGAGVYVHVNESVIGIHCVICDKHVAALRAPSPIIVEGKTTPCHTNGLFAVYRKPSHTIALKCPVCDAIVGTLKLSQPN